MNPQPQKPVRKIKKVDGKDLVERLTFYHSIIPETEEKLWEIIGKEFSLLPREKIKTVLQITGALDVIPETPQPKPESFVVYPELTIYHLDRPKTMAELIERMQRAFPNVLPENLVPTFGIVSISFTHKK